MEELAAVIQSLHEHPTKEEIQEMINEVDPDGDGSIDFEDFLNIMARKLKVYYINLTYDQTNIFYFFYNVSTFNISLLKLKLMH